MAEDLDHLLQLGVAPEDRRQLVLPREQIQVDGELLEKRRQLVALAQLLVAQLDVADDRQQARDDGVAVGAEPAEDQCSARSDVLRGSTANRSYDSACSRPAATAC